MGRTRESLGAATIALLLIVVALLLIANEIRFQGCVSTRYEQIGISADHPRSPVGIQKCSRFPFAA